MRMLAVVGSVVVARRKIIAPSGVGAALSGECGLNSALGAIISLDSVQLPHPRPHCTVAASQNPSRQPFIPFRPIRSQGVLQRFPRPGLQSLLSVNFLFNKFTMVCR